jgi:hypothetical protein
VPRFSAGVRCSCVPVGAQLAHSAQGCYNDHGGDVPSGSQTGGGSTDRTLDETEFWRVARRIGLVVAALCAVCIASILAFSSLAESKAVPAPTQSPLRSITVAPGRIGPSVVATERALPAKTPQAASTPEPTGTVASSPTHTPLPTDTPLATDTPQQPPHAAEPTHTPVGPCPCSGYTLRCDDFGSHSWAQACFDYCKSRGRGDVHGLDGDGDGLACKD